MATYLQGVQDYIPQVQPFQPDLNLYANVLQTKQTQYDTAWKSLNNVYGQYFYSDLTRDNNVERKEEILKNVDFNLKRVSGLDLSLDQNVQQAVQVFKPFYQDKYLMKDMAWTKNYLTKRGRAEGLKNSYDEEQRSQYWDAGVRAMDYMREEFKNSSDDESLSFSNADYTPYVNVTKKAREIAKDAGLSMESIEFSEDGRWIIKNTNGQQLIEPLSKLFEAELGSDPAVQAVYQTQAYVNRKDYAYSNAAQFDGDTNAAEMKYLENSFNVLREQSQIRYNNLQQVSNTYQSQIDDIKKQIANGTATPKAKLALAQYEQAKSINDKVLERVSSENEMINGDETNSTGSTDGFINPYGDIKSLRYKVDNGMASMLMQKDLDEAAEIMAQRGAKVNIDANPYAVKEVEHQYRMQEADLRGQYMIKATQMKIKADKVKDMSKYLVETIGSHRYDLEEFLPDGKPNPNYGNIIPIQAFETFGVEAGDEGAATGKQNAKEWDARINRIQAEEVALPQFNNMVALMREMIGKNQMSKQDADRILGMDYTAFSRQINKNPTWFLTRSLGDKKLTAINNRLNSWITNNSELSGLNSSAYQSLKKSSIVFEDYSKYVKESQEWKKTTALQVEKELQKQGYRYTYLLYDNDGNIRSEEDWLSLIPKSEAAKYRYSRERADYESAPPSEAEIKSGKGRSPYVTGTAYRQGFDYNQMKKAAANIYTSGQISADIIGLDKIGGMSGTGKFTVGRSTAWVNPKAHTTKSMAAFGEILRDLQGFDWGDTTKNRATFSGTSKSDWDGIDKYEMGRTRNDLANTIIGMMRAEVNNPNTKMGNFKIQVAPVAAGDPKKAAIVITPDAEWLKGLVYPVDKEGNPTGAGVISESMYNSIVQNGISMIMDSDKMKNTMYKNAYSTPFKASLDAGQKYTYVDPLNPDRTLFIEPSKLGIGGYDVTGSYPRYDPDKGRIVKVDISPITTYDPEGARDEVLDYFGINQEALRNLNY